MIFSQKQTFLPLTIGLFLPCSMGRSSVCRCRVGVPPGGTPRPVVGDTGLLRHPLDGLSGFSSSNWPRSVIEQINLL